MDSDSDDDVEIALPVPTQKSDAKYLGGLPDRHMQRLNEFPALKPLKPLTYLKKLDIAGLFEGPRVLLLPEVVLTPREPYLKDKAYVNAHNGEVVCGSPYGATGKGNPSASPWNFWINGASGSGEPLRVVFHAETGAKSVILTAAVYLSYGESPTLNISGPGGIDQQFNLKHGKSAYAVIPFLTSDDRWYEAYITPLSGEHYISSISIDSTFS